jgi:hypothetical protein
MAPKVQGTTLVVAGVTLILGTLGIGTIYLPFYADRDKMRGANDNSATSQSSQHEYEKAVHELRQRERMGETQQLNQQQQQQQGGMRHTNSMWGRMNQNAEKK